jgi:hypothetical protein
MRRILLAAALLIVGLRGEGAVLYEQPAQTTGVFYHSSWWDPDGSNYDEYVWDRFVLGSDADVDTIRWRGTHDAAYGGDTPVVNFWVAVYGSSVGGTQPDVSHPPLFEYETAGNAGQTYAGVFGGRTFYDYRFALPTSFHAQAGVPYWVQIEAWQNGYPGWSIAAGSGGDNYHFRCQHLTLKSEQGVPTGCWFTSPSGDAAVSNAGDPPAAPALTIYGATPNPTSGDRLRLAFLLPRSGPAELSLHDAAGRLVARRTVSDPIAGMREEAIPEARALPAGVYYARLRQGAEIRTTKVMVVN